MVDEQKLRQLAIASSLSIQQRADMNEAEFSDCEDMRREFRHNAPKAILSLLDELHTLREERTAWRVTAENSESAVKQARIDALEEAKTLIENYPFWLGTTAKAEICTAIESLKGTP